MLPESQANLPAPVVRISGLRKHYGEAVALAGVELDVFPGEILGLLGANGAGKTTLLECLLGLRTPDAGDVCIEFPDASGPAAARGRIGVQLQAASLQEHITPREALELFGGFHADPAPAGELLEQFGLAAKARAPFGTLSTGQRQRLFLALALVNRPRLLVLDEPTAGLDPQARRELHGLIRRARAEGCAILLSTHYGDEAEQLCDRVAILDGGRILKMDTPEALRRGVSHATVRLVARPMPDEATTRAWPGAIASERAGGEWRITTGNAGRLIAAAAAWAEASGSELVDVQVQRRTLEDVVVDLTGRRLQPESEGDETR